MNANTYVLPRFIWVVLNVKDGNFDKFLLGRLNAYVKRQQGAGCQLTPQQTAQQERLLSTARKQYESVSNAPPPFATAKDYAKLPKDTLYLIKQKSRILGNMLADTFPLTAGESLILTDVTILMMPWEHFDAGTLAYIQETDLARVAFILPYLNFDTQHASLRTLRGTYILTTKSQPQAALVYMRDRRKAEEASLLPAATSVDPGKALLTFATVAAFALPAPYGILLSGALSVVQMFFGGSDENVNAFQQSMQGLLHNIEQYLEMEKIKDAALTIQDALDWLNRNSRTIKDLGNDAAARTFIESKALPFASKVDEINSPLRTALNTLLDIQLPDNNADYDLRKTAFNVLAMGVGTYLTFLRVIIQYQAGLETEKDYTGGKLIYAYYDTFRLESLKWATSLAQRINDLATERINLVGPLVRGEDNQFCFGEWNCRYADATDGYWTFTDNEPGKSSQQGKWQDTAILKSSCGSSYYESVQHKDQAEAARNSYIAQLNADMDADFADAKGMIKGFQDAITTWNENLTPRAPQAAPSVDKDKWAGNVPQGANWVKGAKVRYAVTFVNSSGSSNADKDGHVDVEKLHWGGWIDINDKAWPLLTNIPTDPLCLSTTRHIYRQFKVPDGTDGVTGVIGMIMDNQTTTYQDTHN